MRGVIQPATGSGGGANELLVLYALLHDIGKPVLRYVYRVRDGYEKRDERAEDLLNLLSMEQGWQREYLERRARHEELSDALIRSFLRRLGLADKEHETYMGLVNRIVARSDVAAAFERGLLPGKERVEELSSRLARLIEGHFKCDAGIPYQHHTAPFLSPLWRLEFAGYRRSVGPCAAGAADIKRGYVGSEAFAALREFGEGRLSEDVMLKIYGLPLWLPVLPLTHDNVIGLELRDYCSAAKGARYGEVVGLLWALMADAASIYGRTGIGLSRGLLNTLDSILRVTTSLVPSAVWASPVPDISLYAHSKMTAAIAQAIRGSEGATRARLLRLELHGIQDFVSSPASERAASRILRGRSLLVELVQDAVVNVLLEFLGLASPAVLVSEGGGITMLVPADVDGKRLEQAAGYIYEELAKTFRGRLWASIALSEAFDVFQMRGFEDPQSEFASAVEELLRRDVVEARVESAAGKAELLAASLGRAVAVDSLTREAVYEGERSLVVRAGDAYFDVLAPGKLEDGDVISELTHLSLVCGTAARNAVLIAALRAFEEKEGALLPGSEFASALVDEISGQLKKYLETSVERPLAARVQVAEGRQFVVGLVPLERLGTAYLLISLISREAVEYGRADELRRLYEAFATALFSTLVAGAIRRALSRARARRLVIEFKAVNNPESFVLSGEGIVEALRKIGEELGGPAELDVAFSPAFLNTYHPVKGDGTSLKDLDEMGLIAMGKVDVDRAGEVLRLYTSSPSRLVDFSNMLSAAMNVKPYLLAAREGRDAVILYSGGDDAVAYGSWRDVLLLLGSAIYGGSIKGLLAPLSASIGLSLGKPKVPVLHLYRAAVEELGKAKVVRASASADFLGASLEVECGGAKREVGAIPLECRWGKMCFDKLVELLERWDTLSSSLEEHKQLIYAIGELSSLAASRRTGAQGLVPLIYYAYLCARREEEFEELRKALAEIYEIPVYPDAGLEEIGRALREARPLLDLILLALRTARERP
ncbi:MAG: hypothetical protein ABWK00_01435 [Desulfurococcaceae archaeon]